MRTRLFICLAIMIAAGAAGVGGFTTAASAATAHDFAVAYARGEAANKQAASLDNEWIYTVKVLKAAKKAAAAGNYAKAVKEADHARAMAEVSIEQAKEQAKIWRQAVVR